MTLVTASTTWLTLLSRVSLVLLVYWVMSHRMTHRVGSSLVLYVFLLFYFPLPDSHVTLTWLIVTHTLAWWLIRPEVMTSSPITWLNLNIYSKPPRADKPFKMPFSPEGIFIAFLNLFKVITWWRRDKHVTSSNYFRSQLRHFRSCCPV